MNTTTPQPQKSYSPDQVADLIGVSVQTVYRFMLKGELNSYKIGRTRRITASEISRIQNPELAA